MANSNSYLGRADSDLRYAKCGMQVGEETGDYTGVAALCSQAAEKYFNAIVEYCFADENEFSLLRTHNLRKLYAKITEKYQLDVSNRDCSWLGDFYFDTRYPGDQFSDVSRQEALDCLELTETIKENTYHILEQEKQRRLQCFQNLAQSNLSYKNANDTPLSEDFETEEPDMDR